MGRAGGLSDDGPRFENDLLRKASPNPRRGKFPVPLRRDARGHAAAGLSLMGLGNEGAICGRPAHDHWMNSPSSGQHTAAKADVQPESRSLVRLSYATEVRVVAATALLPMWSRSFSTSFTRPWLTS